MGLNSFHRNAIRIFVQVFKFFSETATGNILVVACRLVGQVRYIPGRDKEGAGRLVGQVRYIPGRDKEGISFDYPSSQLCSSPVGLHPDEHGMDERRLR